MSPFRYRDEESTATHVIYVALGALAGFAAGVVVSQQYGGISGLTAKIRERLGSKPHDDHEEHLGAQGRDHDYGDEYDDDEYDDDEYAAEPSGPGEELEERVLEAFRNDPVLSERAIDIGAIEEGIVELSGWVHADEETEQAIVIARGVPGVETVVNRLSVRADEELFDELADRYADGDPSLTGGHWEGQQVGTGRRRQGTSDEPDRHEDPKPELEEAQLDRVYLDAEDETEVKAERRTRAKPPRGGRADGSAIAPSGVPKSDHVADPLSEQS